MPLGLKIREATDGENGPVNGPVNEPVNGPDLVFPDMEELSADPPPADDDTPPNTAPKSAPKAAPPLTKAQEREVKDEVAATLEMFALAWSIPDPHCGIVLHENSEKIASALTQCLRRNPRLLAYMRSSGWFGDYLKLFMVTLPVGRAIWAHHVAPAPEENTTNGYTGDPTAPHVPFYPPYLPRPQTGNAWAPDTDGSAGEGLVG